jgi:uncharacterized protein
MKIFLHELSTKDTELEFNQDEGWVLAAIEKVDEKLENEDKPTVGLRKSAPRPSQVRFNLRKVDDVVVVDGEIDTAVKLVCSRCAIEFEKPCTPEFNALFCKDPDMAGVAHLAPRGSEDAGKPMGQNKGVARTNMLAFDTVDTAKDLDITYLSQDFIDLADVLTEQLRLQVPFQPLCKEDCKGMCANCGADQNTGRCACPKLVKNTAFSVLKDLKV